MACDLEHLTHVNVFLGYMRWVDQIKKTGTHGCTRVGNKVDVERGF